MRTKTEAGGGERGGEGAVLGSHAMLLSRDLESVFIYLGKEEEVSLSRCFSAPRVCAVVYFRLGEA